METMTAPVERIRPRVIGYCRGFGLDVGCGDQRILPTALGIDTRDLGHVLHRNLNESLVMFAPESVDYIFCSHTLEQLDDPQVRLMEWWDKLKFGGYLILYCKHKSKLTEHDRTDRWEFEPADIETLVDRFALYHLEEGYEDAEGESFLRVYRKLGTAHQQAGREMIPEVKGLSKQKALVIRYGGIGDHVMVTPVFRRLKEEGWDVTYNTNPLGEEVTRHNPFIDRYVIQDRLAVPNDHLGYYWEEMAKGYSKVINLSGSIEKTLLTVPEDPEYHLSTEERQALFSNVDYYQKTMESAGMEYRRETGELFFSPAEEMTAKVFRKLLRDRFLVLWSLSGSAVHKSYPYYLEAMDAFGMKYKKALFITVGGYVEKLLEFNCDGPNYLPKSGVWDLRTSMVMAKYADLIVAGQTGMIAVAGAFDTPKLCFLTHSSWMNLCRNWKNDYSLQSRARCSPCHRMIFSVNDCEKDPTYGVNICAEQFDHKEIANKMEGIYKNWDRRNLKLVDKIILPRRG